MIIYVTGPLGSDRHGLAEKTAKEYGLPLYDLEAEIEKRDGRSIRRIVMMMGEHELRNKEYETLVALLGELGESDSPDTVDPDLPVVCSRCKGMEAEADGETLTAPGDVFSAVICCNDDVVLDPMSYDLLKAGKVLIADDDPEVLFKRASADQSTHYAFLMDPDEERRRTKFMELYERRKGIYEELASE